MAAGIMRILHQRGVQSLRSSSLLSADDGPVSLSGVNNNALSGRTNGVYCRATGDTVIRGITPPSSNHFNAELVIRDSDKRLFSR